MSKPLVGITSYAVEARWGAWTLPAALVPLSYVRSVELAGGRPLVVPPAEDALDETLAALDGLIFSGGADIDPGAYGAEPHPETAMVQPERDRAELALLEAAIARDMPVLAICRGMQLLNVLRGGDLHQHLPDLIGHEDHRGLPGTFSDHAVRVEQRSRIGRIVGATAEVKSSHHQGLDRVGDGLDVVGWTEDGSVEAIEDPERRFAVGVLWHPEEGEDKRLFEALVAEAARYRDERERTSGARAGR